jgi:hypothetical protein
LFLDKSADINKGAEDQEVKTEEFKPKLAFVLFNYYKGKSKPLLKEVLNLLNISY